MENEFEPLEFHPLETGATYSRPTQTVAGIVKETDPALEVMTDLSQITLFTAELSTPLAKALETMVNRGVRMLLVRDSEGIVKGLITSRDIESSKTEKILQKAGGHWEDLLVCDLMTLGGKVEVLLMNDVRKARVGDIIATLRKVNRQHAMVLETDPSIGRSVVRGIFSLSQIATQLGLDIDPSEGPTTFAEFDRAKNRPPA